MALLVSSDEYEYCGKLFGLVLSELFATGCSVILLYLYWLSRQPGPLSSQPRLVHGWPRSILGRLVLADCLQQSSCGLNLSFLVDCFYFWNCCSVCYLADCMWVTKGDQGGLLSSLRAGSEFAADLRHLRLVRFVVAFLFLVLQLLMNKCEFWGTLLSFEAVAILA